MITFYRQLLAFTIERQLNKELEDFVSDWNSHRMRKNKKIGFPGGIPDDLFSMPELYGVCMHYNFHGVLLFLSVTKCRCE